MSEKLISIKDLSKTYKNREIFRNANMFLDKEQMAAVIGLSGIGKTTLLNIVGLLDQDYKGEYLLDGQNYQKLKSNAISKIRSRKIGFIFQNYYLLEYMNVYDNIIMPLEYQHLSYKKSDILDMIKLADLEDQTYQSVATLSGGEKQRVAILRAIVHHPELIIADEPTGNLDELSTQKILELLKLTHMKYGSTLIVVTHNPHILSFFDKVFEIKEKGIYEK